MSLIFKQVARAQDDIKCILTVLVFVSSSNSELSLLFFYLTLKQQQLKKANCSLRAHFFSA